MAKSTMNTMADKARKVLRTLEEEAFSTAAQLRLISGHQGDEKMARELVKLYCSLFPDDPELGDQDELTRLAGFLVLLVGRPAAEGIANAAPASIGGLLLRRYMGLPLDLPVPEVDIHQFALPGEAPAEWPVVATYATVPDGYGNQALYVFRRRHDGALALAGLIFSEIRGIADAVANPRISQAEADLVVAELHDASGGLFAAPPGYLMGRAREGMAIAAAKGIPLPLEVRLQDYLLAGLWDLPAHALDPAHPSSTALSPLLLPLLAAAGPDHDAIPDTPSPDTPFVDHVCLESWFLTELDGPEVRPFLHAMAVAAQEGGDLDSLLEDYAVPILAPLQDRLADRLAHAAFLFGTAGLHGHAAGAAKAARDLLEGPSAATPFCRWLLLRTFLESEFGWLIEGWDLVPSPPSIGDR